MKQHRLRHLIFNITLTITLSVTITLINKLALSKFPFPITLTALHQLACLLVTRLIPKTKSITFKYGLKDAFIAGSTNVFGIVLMNMSIMLNPITVHQIAKLLSVPTLVLLERLIFCAAVPSRSACMALSVLLLGVGFSTTSTATSSTPTSSFMGLGVTSLAVLTTAFAQAALQHLPSFKGMSGLGLVSAISPWSALTASCLALLIDGTSLLQTTTIPYLSITMSCLLAVGANIVGNSLIKSTSALTYNVVGHGKTLFTIAFGILLFPTQQSLTAINLFGIALALLGMSLYSFFQYKDAKLLSKAKLSPVAVQFSIPEHTTTDYRVLKENKSRP